MTVPALNNLIKGILTRAGTDNPDGDAREIAAAALGIGYNELSALRSAEVTPEAHEKAVQMALRRAEGTPIQYVIGSWSFMGREFKVGEGVLIPRDDTEVVVSEAIKAAAGIGNPLTVDLCSGSGIIAVTLEKELNAPTVYAVEKSEEAYRYLTENIRLNNSAVKPVLSDLSDCTDIFEDGSIDLLISNPPYIPTAELPSLQSEVRREPAMALDGGENGCDFYDMIITLWTPKVKPGGIIAFEIGEDQFEYISALLESVGYTSVKGFPDIQGITRAVIAVKPPPAPSDQ